MYISGEICGLIALAQAGIGSRPAPAQRQTGGFFGNMGSEHSVGGNITCVAIELSAAFQ